MTIQVAGSRRTGVASRADDETLRTDHLFPVSNFPFFFANSPHLTLLQSVFLVTISHVTCKVQQDAYYYNAERI